MSAPAVNEWRIGAALARAQLQATLDRLDTGSGHTLVRLYATARPDDLGTPAAPMAEIPWPSLAGRSPSMVCSI